MSGETSKDESGWTVDTLKALMDSRFDDTRKLMDERKSDQARAVDKALEAVDKRLDGMNEFRATLADQSKTTLSRAEYDSAHEALVDRVNQLSSRMDRAEGRGSGLNAGWIYLLGGIAAFGTIVSLLLVLR